MEHQRRIKGRDMDMAAVGRRAVAAYAHTAAAAIAGFDGGEPCQSRFSAMV